MFRLLGFRLQDIFLPQYTAVREKSALELMRQLAHLGGLLLFTDGDGDLHIAADLPVPGSTIIGPEDGFIQCAAQEQRQRTGVYAQGTGALGSGGPGAETWVSAEASALSAGDYDAAGWHQRAGMWRAASDVQHYAATLDARWSG